MSFEFSLLDYIRYIRSLLRFFEGLFAFITFLFSLFSLACVKGSSLVPMSSFALVVFFIYFSTFFRLLNSTHILVSRFVVHFYFISYFYEFLYSFPVFSTYHGHLRWVLVVPLWWVNFFVVVDVCLGGGDSCLHGGLV